MAMTRELERALDTLATRQRTLTNNVANINTPNFKRSDVDFYSFMREVFNGRPTAAQVTEDRVTADRLDGNNVTLEHEMFALQQTEIMYQAATRFTTGAIQRMSYAITDGRG